MLAVAPGATGALLVVALPARDADHVSIVRPSRDACSRVPTRSGLASGHSKSGCDRVKGAAALRVDVVVWPKPGPRLVRAGSQAAFARRIRRRRSAERSSSFRPPQEPYFSGRETA